MATLANTPPIARNMMPPISLGASATAHTWAMPSPLQASNHLLALNSERYTGFPGSSHYRCVSPTQDSNQEPMK